MLEYRYASAAPTHAHAYLMPIVARRVEEALAGKERRLFDLGCGNGSAGAALAQQGIEVTGVDPSASGVAEANATFPHLRVEVGSAYDDLRNRFGTFPVVISLEVVEHVYDPRAFARTVHSLLEPSGVAIISTPFHGYWKNLALAVSGKMDAHFGPLWDGGHIKFWSRPTLSQLLLEAGFRPPAFDLVGRVKPLAKSMLAVAPRR